MLQCCFLLLFYNIIKHTQYSLYCHFLPLTSYGWICNIQMRKKKFNTQGWNVESQYPNECPIKGWTVRLNNHISVKLHSESEVFTLMHTKTEQNLGQINAQTTHTHISHYCKSDSPVLSFLDFTNLTSEYTTSASVIFTLWFTIDNKQISDELRQKPVSIMSGCGRDFTQNVS